MRDNIREKILDILFIEHKKGNAYLVGDRRSFWVGDVNWVMLPEPFGWRVDVYLWQTLKPLFHQIQCDTGIMRSA